MASILDVRACGVLLHISSLPGPHGIGDFGPAAYRFVDWLESAGQTLWQLLPMQPLGPGHSPYQSVSAFAGSPLMVALEPLIDQGWLRLDPPAPAFSDQRAAFDEVIPWRMARLRDAAAGFAVHADAADRQSMDVWCASQADWLDDYALFMALENAQSGRPWWLWPPPLARRDPVALDAARAEHATEIAFWQFVQWCFEVQWQSVKAYAGRRGIAVMGDVPIFVAHHSADCWARPDLYFLDDAFQPTVVAGVPPDLFSATGQRWGNPLYRWDRMAAQGYAWWIARLRRALAHLDVFRIDHFRGFAGYWEVPADCPTAIEGRWVEGPGRALFDAIESALGALPIVAEDLGVITPDVEALRDACGFPGMRILQFAFAETAEHAYLPHHHVPRSVVYTGTHDNDTLVGWWAGTSPRERELVHAYVGTPGEPVHWQLMRAACHSVARLAVFPLQDVLGLDGTHRLNTPGMVGGDNWAWRFDWAMVGTEPGRALARLAAATGRAPFARLGDPLP